MTKMLSDFIVCEPSVLPIHDSNLLNSIRYTTDRLDSIRFAKKNGFLIHQLPGSFFLLVYRNFG